jgi:PilZ domain
MRNKREHTRFDLIDIQGKMTLANKVEIIDISLGGIALKADRKLDVGREYMIKLGDKEHGIDVKGIVVRSTLVGMEAGVDGESVLIYAAGMKFKEGSEDKITAFLNSVEHHTKEEEAQMVERRQTVRFQITAPQENVLVFPANFRVKDITLSSMLIQADQPLEKGSMIPLELYLNENDHLNFIGKVFSSRNVENKEQVSYEIEVTYPDLAAQDRAMLKKFIDYLVTDHIAGKAD